MDFSAPTLWWVLAGVLVVAELLSGTFYLLMIALGAAAGAGVGYGVGRGSVTCVDYPPQVTQTDYSREHCRWVQQSPQDGKPRQFEVCQNADGVWRASGRE